MSPLRYTDGREWRKGIPQEEPMSERISDVEWAAGVMGDCWCQHPGCAAHPRRAYDTDANAFRDLLNCEAVKEGWAGQDLSVCGREDLREALFVHALWDQPAALRRLREAVEGEA